MPLPVPLASTQASRTLLFHPRVAEEAHRLLSTRDDALAAQLQLALTATSHSPQHIILRDQRYENYGQVDPSQPYPELLGAILQRNPHVFRQQQQHHHHPQQWNAHPQSTNMQQSMLYSPHNQQQQIGYSSPAAHVGAYTPSVNANQVIFHLSKFTHLFLKHLFFFIAGLRSPAKSRSGTGSPYKLCPAG